MMDGVIILGGGGDEHQSRRLDAEYKKLLPKGDIKCLYIPTALALKDYSTACEWFTKNYKYISSVSVFDEHNPDASLLEQLYDTVYIGGGNTGHLLDVIKQHNIHVFIREQLEKGCVLYGGSAGAIILGKTIRTAPRNEWPHQVNLGLDMLNGFSVIPHYNHRDFPTSMINILMSDNKTNIICITLFPYTTLFRSRKSVV